MALGSMAGAGELTLADADIEDAFALSSAAGWNQTADDWRVFVIHGRVFVERDEAARVVATAAILPYGSTAWLSMVLVQPALQHRGVASRLVEACLSCTDALGAAAVLDATAAGEPVYRKLGFQPGFAFERWQGHVAAPPSGKRVAQGDEVEAMAYLDAVAGGTERRFLFDAFLSRPATQAWSEGGGFVLSRAGVRAAQIGPLVAADETSAWRLLDTALQGTGGEIFVDVPVRWTMLGKRLLSRGFARQRPFVRMARGGTAPMQAGDAMFAVAGPEFG